MRAVLLFLLVTLHAGGSALAGDAQAVEARAAGSTSQPLCDAVLADDLTVFRSRLVRLWQVRHRESGAGLTDQQIVTQFECDGMPLLVYAQSVQAATVSGFLLAGSIDEQVVEQALRQEGREVSGNP